MVSLTAGGGVCLYTFTTYMQKFLVNTAGLDVGTASNVMLAAMVGFMVLQPAIGALSQETAFLLVIVWLVGALLVAALVTDRAEITG